MKTYKAHYTSSGNIKLGSSMGVWSVLYGNQEHYVEEMKTTVKGTCGHHCNGCLNDCYVRKSYRYGSVIKGHARNTVAMRTDLAQCLADLDEQLSRKRKPFKFVRVNQSGEVEDHAQFAMHCEIGRRHPETQFYIYSKAYEIVVPALLLGRVPDNMTVLISIWHEYGIEAWNKVKHLPNVKAYVYDDGYDYSQHGLIITDRCYAYDEHGKLNHDLTCEKCQKCMNRLERSKVIACKAH